MLAFLLLLVLILSNELGNPADAPCLLTMTWLSETIE